jgi:hypothetical protein
MALGLLAVACARWILTIPPKLHLRRILEPPPESRNELAEIKGYSPDGSLLAVSDSLGRVSLYDVPGKER